MFILMISFAILIWIASGDNSADPSLLAEVCVSIYTLIFRIMLFLCCSYKFISCVGLCRYFCFNSVNHRRRNMLLW